MTAKVHDLEIEPQYLRELLAGTKTFEVRERRDRDFRLGDMLRFTTGGHAYLFDVTYVLAGGKYGIDPDYCVMGVRRSVVYVNG